LPPESKTQLPVQLLELLELRELTYEQLQSREFNGRKVGYLKDTITKKRMNHEHIYDQELFRTYEFVEGKVLVISESNDQGRVDPQPNSLSRILKILGREDVNLPSSGGNENREYVYGDF
jgi:hypothetical protein